MNLRYKQKETIRMDGRKYNWDEQKLETAMQSRTEPNLLIMMMMMMMLPADYAVGCIH